MESNTVGVRSPHKQIIFTQAKDLLPGTGSNQTISLAQLGRTVLSEGPVSVTGFSLIIREQ